MGALVFLVHVGTVNLPIGLTIARGLPFKLVTNSVSYGLRYREHVIDALGPKSSTILAQMQASLRRGEYVLVAVDGNYGPRLGSFDHESVAYPMASGPVFLAHHMRVRSCLLATHHECEQMRTVLTDGPEPTPGLALKDWQDQWFAIFREQVLRIVSGGPENHYKHAVFAYR
jgi:hypothetical protein